MPLDYRILLGAQPPQPFSSLANMQQLGQMADEDRAQQQDRQAQQVIQGVLSKHADNPDAVPAELLRRGLAKQAMAFDEHLSKQRKAILDQRNSELDLQVKAGTIEKNKADLEKAAHVDPKAVLPYLANQTDQEGYDEGIALAKLAHGKNADAILASLPKIWSPEVSKRIAGMLMTPDQVADNASKAAGGGQQSDYATFLARYAAGLGKPPNELSAQEELGARTQFYGAQKTGGGGTDFGTFIDNYIKGEAEKLGKTVDTLGPATTAALTLKGRKLYEAANDSPQAGPSKTLSATAESNIINRLSNQWMTASKSSRELDRAVSLMDTGMTAARRGDMAQGAQAVLVTFQKILDPTSVVRESEYARSSAGLALIDRIQGAYERLAKGGAGVPISELEKFARLAKDMADAQRSTVTATRERLGKTADRYNIPRELVTDETGEGRSAGAATPTTPTLTKGATYDGEVRQAGDGRILGRINGQVVELVKSGAGYVVK